VPLYKAVSYSKIQRGRGVQKDQLDWTAPIRLNPDRPLRPEAHSSLGERTPRPVVQVRILLPRASHPRRVLSGRGTPQKWRGRRHFQVSTDTQARKPSRMAYGANSEFFSGVRMVVSVAETCIDRPDRIHSDAVLLPAERQTVI